MSKDNLGDVTYQHAGAVRQALAERASARELGNTDAVAAAEKRLAAAGYTDPDSAPKVDRTTPPAERETRQERASRTAAAASSGDSPRSTTPRKGD